jgi:hypothetical protein
MAMDISSFMTFPRIEVKMSLLLLPLVFILSISIPNSPTYQILAQSSIQSNEQSFASSFQSIVNETRLLAHDYDIQVQKWQRGELSNETMASTTDTYLPRYQELITKTKDLETPTNYENVTKLYAKSLESELQSNTHFRNYLLTGNSTQNEASQQFLSDAFKYELESFNAFKSASESNNR